MVTVAYWTIGGLLIFQLLLLVFMMLKKRHELEMIARLRVLDEKLTAEFEAFIQGESPHHPRFPEKNVLKVQLMEEILERSLEDADDLQAARIRNLAEESLTEEYHKRLQHGGWANRINALYFIEDFKMYNLMNEVFNTADESQKREDEEFRQGLRTMSALQDRRVFGLIEKHDQLPVPLLKEIFQRLNISAVDDWIPHFNNHEDIPEHLLGALISHCGDVKVKNYQHLVEQCLTDSRGEIRIKALKAMGLYGEVLNHAGIEAFFESDHWEERLMVAKLIGYANLLEYKNKLKIMMSDREWWVRYVAANALRKLEGGEAMLRKIAESDKDPYARDMAGHTLTTKWGLTS